MAMFRKGAAIAMVLLVSQTCAVAANAVTPSHEFSGIWLAERTIGSLRAVDGSMPPLTPEGRAAYQTVASGLKSAKIQDLTRKYCLPDGVPRLLTARYPFEIVLTPGQVTFLHEARHVYRALPLGVPPLDPNLLIESYMGNANARWEGNVLIIESIAFNGETWLDDSGLQHSDELQTVERWQTLAGGRRLQVDVTISDSRYFQKPWTTRMTFAKKDELGIVEYACGEQHRNFSGKAGK